MRCPGLGSQEIDLTVGKYGASGNRFQWSKHFIALASHRPTALNTDYCLFGVLWLAIFFLLLAVLIFFIQFSRFFSSVWSIQTGPGNVNIPIDWKCGTVIYTIAI